MQSIRPTAYSVVGLLVALPVFVIGCQELVNPWQDRTVGPDLVTSASINAAHARDSQQDLKQRGFETTLISAQDGSVYHFPLWFEDPFEVPDRQNDRMAWGWWDYIAMPYGLGRYIVNGIGVPVSAVVYPPAPYMVSDGIVTNQGWWRGDLDPEWRPGTASATPPDILEIGANGVDAPQPDA